jgi:DNA processing protein
VPTNQLSDWLKLLHVPGLGPRAYLRLLEYFNNEPWQVFSASCDQLIDSGISQKVADAIIHSPTTEYHHDLDWLESDPNHHIITLADDDYPPLLREIADCPPVLFIIGAPGILTENPAISIVGSRNATKFGEHSAFEFAKSLSQYGITIVSGLAYGIDSHAHQGALAGNAHTVAVLAHGPDIVYPRAHKHLSQLICHQGALISEFAPGTKPLAGFFPRRNRIISGLCLGTLVVEAAKKRGSLITARYALEQNREVFALPGSINSRQSQGCNVLIQNGAKLTCCVEDILSEFYPERLQPQLAPEKISSLNTLPVDLVDLLAKLEAIPTSIDDIVEKSGLTPDKVSSMLMELEVSGHVLCSACGQYSKVCNGIM